MTVIWSEIEFNEKWTEDWLKTVIIVKYEHDYETQQYTITYKEV